jgi:hypothetical protein
MSAYIEVSATKLGEQTLQFEGKFSGTPVLRGDFVMDVKNIDDPAIVAIPSFPLFVQRSGSFTIDLMFEGRRHRIVSKLVRCTEPTQG